MYGSVQSDQEVDINILKHKCKQTVVVGSVSACIGVFLIVASFFVDWKPGYLLGSLQVLYSVSSFRLVKLYKELIDLYENDDKSSTYPN
jgi:hypothetical protein